MYLEALKYFNISANLKARGNTLEINKEDQYSQYVNNCRFAIHAMEDSVEFKFENMGENINTENANKALENNGRMSTIYINEPGSSEVQELI